MPLLLASGHLPHLKSLDFTGTPLGGKALSKLLHHPDCRPETLLLGGVEAKSINAPWRTGHKWAAMSTCELGEEGLEAILSSPQLGELRKLDLSYTVARPETWERFASSALVSQFTHFAAAMTEELSAASLCTIFARAPRLEGLALACADLGVVGAGALIAAPSSGHLTKLDLGLCRLTSEGAEALLNAPFPNARANLSRSTQGGSSS